MRIPSTNLHWIEQFNETRRATGENEGHLSEKLANQEQETAKGMYNPRVDVNLQLQWICGKVFAREKKILYLNQQQKNKSSPLTKNKASHTVRKPLVLE